jgi:ABC-2 type transport system permease protein
MRLMADEKRSGTLDVLLACPVQEWEVILGKYLGSLAFYGVMLLATLHYPLLLTLLGRPDYVPMLVGYLGVFLLGGAVLATGLFTSTLTTSQIVAYVSAFGVLLLLWSLGSVGAYLGGVSATLFDFVSLTRHYDDFTRGILDSRHLIYYLTWIFLFLALSVRSLGLRRWL